MKKCGLNQKNFIRRGSWTQMVTLTRKKQKLLKLSFYLAGKLDLRTLHIHSMCLLTSGTIECTFEIKISVSTLEQKELLLLIAVFAIIKRSTGHNPKPIACFLVFYFLPFTVELYRCQNFGNIFVQSFNSKNL